MNWYPTHLKIGKKTSSTHILGDVGGGRGMVW